MRALSLDTLPIGFGNGCAFSTDGVYLAVTYETSPYLALYKREGNSFIKLPNPSILPPGEAKACAFSADDTYLAVTHDESPRITIYKRSGDIFTKLSNPSTLPAGDAVGCAFSADGIYLAVAHKATPYVTIYKRSGDIFTKLSNPSALPAGTPTDCAFSSDGTYLAVAHSSSPYVTIYKRSGDVFTRLSNPSPLPTGLAWGCTFSLGGNYLALALNSGSNMLIYKRNGDTFTVLANPAYTPPDEAYGCRFSPDDAYLVYAAISDPNVDGLPVVVYDHDGDTFTLNRKLSESIGDVNDYGVGCAFSADSTYFAAVYHDEFCVRAYNWILDELPASPTLITPKDAYIGINSDQTFEWQHNISSGTEQTYADLQYRIIGSAWQALVSVSGAGMSAIIPAYTFSSGRYQWRARTYNLNGDPGDWSDPVSFVGVGQPARPNIDAVSNVSRPMVSWSSADQIAYQLQILQNSKAIYDTGETAGTGKSHTVKLFLSNGDYIVKLRIKNASLFWSGWTEHNFSVSVVPPVAPSIAAEPVANGARIVITGSGSNKAYLLRDGIPIADITGLPEYFDYAALGAVQYVVRVVDDTGNYADSLPAVTLVSVSCVVLAAEDDIENVIEMNRKAAGQAAVTGQRQLTGTLHYYAGREFPVYTYDGTANEQYSPTFYYTDPSEWKRLNALIDRRRTLLYRDCLGNRFYGVITSVSHTEENGMINFALTFLRVDYSEAIGYEV